MMYDVVIVGGGAAGFYGALHLAEGAPQLKIAVLEKGRKVLTKVKVSGGGRCNLTNATQDPNLLIQHYPRGSKELLGPFYTHGSRETGTFFERHGIRLKTEDDGRVFPTTDDSKTVIDFFLRQAEKYGIQIFRNTRVVDLLVPDPNENPSRHHWQIVCDHKVLKAKKLFITTGGNTKIWQMLARLGYHIVPPVPSLFSFNIKDDRVEGMQGISLNARVSILNPAQENQQLVRGLRSRPKLNKSLTAEGPLLITHWGLSGPVILKLSAWAARELCDYGYRFRIRVNWIPDYHARSVAQILKQIKSVEARKTVIRTQAFDLPRKLWGKLVKASGVGPRLNWAQMSNPMIDALAEVLCASEFSVEGKSTNKDEFVTAGGVELKQIDFKTFESKHHPGLYFAGEVLNIDGITGGFNFQSAWTGSFIAAQAILSDSQ